MAKFVPGTDTQVVSAEPLLEVLASPSTPLQPGRHVFQLVVTDMSGNASTIDSMTVVVQDPSRPNAVIDFIRDDSTRVYESTPIVPYGKPFRLTGERSNDRGGTVTSWRWTLVSR